MKKDDLRVENYDAEKVAAKKRSIKRRVAVAGGVVALTLGLFGLMDYAEWRRGEAGEVIDIRTIEELSIQEIEELRMTMGGSGSWFASVLERVRVWR